MTPEIVNGCELYLGDCLSVLPTLAAGSVDAVVTDPPYGMNNDPDSSRFSGGQSPLISRVDGTPAPFPKPILGDDTPFDPEHLLAYPRVVIWGYNHFSSKLPKGTTLVWIKKDAHLWGTFLSDAEVAWMKGGCGVYLFQRNWSGFSRLTTVGKSSHPNEKPIELIEWCMDMLGLPAGAKILDPYMGSGTTGVACIQTGRSFIGIEKYPAYYAIAKRRILQAQPPLFVDAPAEPVATQLEFTK